MANRNLEYAKQYAFYVDGFGLAPLLERQIPGYETNMWFFLFQAAEAGEIL